MDPRVRWSNRRSEQGATGARANAEGAVRWRLEEVFQSARSRSTAAGYIPDLTLRTGDIARARRVHGRGEEGVMTGAAEGNDGKDEPCYDPEALMQDWREWMERWERLVRSR